MRACFDWLAVFTTLYLLQVVLLYTEMMHQ